MSTTGKSGRDPIDMSVARHRSHLRRARRIHPEAHNGHRDVDGVFASATHAHALAGEGCAALDARSRRGYCGFVSLDDPEDRDQRGDLDRDDDDVDDEVSQRTSGASATGHSGSMIISWPSRKTFMISANEILHRVLRDHHEH